jgi:thiol:disulfide interchange protein DsbD
MIKPIFRLLLAAITLAFSLGVVFAQTSADVNVSGQITPDKIKKGRVARAVVELNIPSGLHVQSSKPLDKFLVATKLDVDAPSGMQTGPISYPRALMRKLKFSKGVVAVYEGRTMIRFNVTVPANFYGDGGEIKAKLRFQACNDESCFPPVTREVKMRLYVE